MKKKSVFRKGQITIFVIISLLLVVVIFIIFILMNPPVIEVSDKENPYLYIESCTKQNVKKALEKIQETGGDIEVNKLSVMYKNVNRSYLCYSSQYYKPCVNQRPKLIEHIESEITNYIRPYIEECFASLKSDLSKKYKIEIGNMKINTRILPKEVLVEINRKFIISRGENIVNEFENFRIKILHPIYDLAKVSAEIVNQESEFCNFNSLGYMTLHPEFDITRFKTGDDDIIYTIVERNSKESFNFAIRSCSLPPGF